MADLFDFDERAAMLVLWWFSISYVFLQDASALRKPVTAYLGIVCGVISLLIVMTSVQFDYFPDLKRRKIANGGHDFDVALSANRTALTILVFSAKFVVSAMRHPEYKMTITCPVELMTMTAGEFQAMLAERGKQSTFQKMSSN